jgi:hypothetical protein
MKIMGNADHDERESLFQLLDRRRLLSKKKSLK